MTSLPSRSAGLILALGLAAAGVAGCSSSDGASAASGSSGAGAGGTQVHGVTVTKDAAAAKLLPSQFASGIRVVTSAPFPPFETYDASHRLTGVDIDTANAIAAKLGTKATVSSIGYDAVIPAVQSGKYDLVLADMGDTKDREQALDFVDYSTQGDVLIVKAGNPDKIHALTDLCGKTVSLEAGDFGAHYFDVIQNQCKKNGKGAVTVKTLPKTSDALLAVQSGGADAQYVSIGSAEYLVKSAGGGNSFEIVAPAGQKSGWDPQHVGAGIPKSATGLRDAVKAALESMRADGTLKKLFDSYGLGSVASDTISVNDPVSQPIG